jgi:ParB family chromosome partitioning protein
MPRQRLGKGLEALIPTVNQDIYSEGGQPHMAVELIDPNPMQPRRDFGDEEMADLIASIESKGILQPLTVRETEEGRYQLVAGERRLRAAKSLGLASVPVYVLGVDTDADMMEYSLIENIQREDLNPIEQAEAFALLHSKYDLTQEEIARQVGMSRPAVANTMRLLRLPTEIKESLKENEISGGHARALLALPQVALMQRMWKKIMGDGLSVRQTEAAVQDLIGEEETKPLEAAEKSRKKTPPKTALMSEAEARLLERLNTKVRVKPRANDTGTIEISYYSEEDLQRLLDIILSEET